MAAKAIIVCLGCGVPYAHHLAACPKGLRFCKYSRRPLARWTVGEWIEQIEEVNLSARQNATDHLSRLR